MKKRQIKPETLSKKLQYLGMLKNYSDEIMLVSYALMPNHIHLELQQKNARSISKFIQSLHTRYAMYHSKKYGTTGPLFQDRFKATHKDSNSFVLDVSKYIHLNPRDIGQDTFRYRWSSLKYYNGTKKPTWLNSKILKEKFSESRYATHHKDYIAWIKDGP